MVCRVVIGSFRPIKVATVTQHSINNNSQGMATLALLLCLLVVSALVWLVRSLPCCCGRREAAQWFRFGAAGGRLECACDTCLSSSSSSSLRTKRARLVSKHRLRVAVIGAGPAGASAAYQLGQRGHDVTVYEACDKVGPNCSIMPSMQSNEM